jgi:hypothetical protein
MRSRRRTASAAGTDARRAAPQAPPLDQSPCHQLGNVLPIGIVTSLDLRERLGVQIEVPEGHLPLLGDKRAAVFPPGLDGDEVCR